MAPFCNKFSRLGLAVLAAAVLLAIPVVAATSVAYRAENPSVSIAPTDNVVANGHITEPVRTISTGSNGSVNQNEQGTTVATDWIYTLTKRPTPGT